MAQSATEEAPRGTKRHRDATRKRHPLKCHHLIQRHKAPCIHHAAMRLRVTRRAHATQPPRRGAVAAPVAPPVGGAPVEGASPPGWGHFTGAARGMRVAM